MGLSVSDRLLCILNELKCKWYLEHRKYQWRLFVLLLIVIALLFFIIKIVNKRVQKTPKSPCFIFLGDWEDRGMLKGIVKSKEGTDLFWSEKCALNI